MMNAGRDESRHLARTIDRLLDACADPSELIAAAKLTDPAALAERIRRHAARKVRGQPIRAQMILQIRDRLMRAVYASRLPADGFSAWCDGSSVSTASAAANGIGAIVTDAHGELVAERSDRIPAGITPFDTEIAALEGALALALEHGATYLRAHTDCPALVRLWRRHPHDRRFVAIRRLVRRLDRFELRAVPREHNQPAHRLAKTAAQSSTGPADAGASSRPAP
ncbi:ribonuclease H family protein [Methylocaldum sp. MU1018]